MSKYDFENLFDQENKNVGFKDELALSVLEGLSREKKHVSSRYFYDGKGSELFKKITDLDEYYPTRCEFEILDTHKKEILALLGNSQVNLVELGAGDGRKTKILLEYLVEQKKDFTYFPLDISESAVFNLLQDLEVRYGSDKLKAKGLVAEYFQGLSWLSQHNESKNFVLFLGSNLGNFELVGAKRFLRHLWYVLNPGDMLLVGFDLKKDPGILYRAYNDSKGVTAEFNLNLLDRINEELNADFDRSKFIHSGHYDVHSGAMESFLISTVDQDVNIGELDKKFHFKAWEGIHTEFSYKYSYSDIVDLSRDAGFEMIDSFYDSKKYFVDVIWRVKK